MTLKIMLAGDFAFDRLAASWERGLRANRVELVRFDVRTQRKRLNWLVRDRIGHRLTLPSLQIRRWAARGYNDSLVEQARASGANVLVLHNGDFTFPETVGRLRELGVRTVLFHADNPLPPHAAAKPETLPLAMSVDLLLTWSERLAKKLMTFGARNARFFPFAWDDVAFPYDTPPANLWTGVLFVGGWDPERERVLEAIADHFPLKIYGPAYWGTRTRRNGKVRARWCGHALSGKEAAVMARQSAISLNILRTQHIIDGAPSGVIMRHFEIPGAGGFLLSTRSGSATRLFPEGEAAAYFADLDECIRKAEKYLADVPARRAIANHSHALVAEKHTYAIRMAEMCRLLEDR